MGPTATAVVCVVGGVGLAALASLCVLRWFRSRKWLDLSRYPELKTKSLSGRVTIITGGNTGLGFEVAKDFARRGADVVILACRNVAAGNEAADEIVKETGNRNVKCLLLDLASLDSVRRFAGKFREIYGKLDCLVCNAGVWVPMEEGSKTADGYEVHFGVNHLGHFLLANMLSDLLVESAPEGSRLVVVSSNLMLDGVVDMSRLDIFNGRVESGQSARRRRPANCPSGYRDSKLMNALFAKEFSQRFPSVGAYSVSPGWCKTDLSRHVLTWKKRLVVLPFAFLFMRSGSRGAQNIIYVAVEDKENLKRGGFYMDGKLAQRENDKLDALAVTARDLWQMSENLTSLPSS